VKKTHRVNVLEVTVDFIVEATEGVTLEVTVELTEGGTVPAGVPGPVDVRVRVDAQMLGDLMLDEPPVVVPPGENSWGATQGSNPGGWSGKPDHQLRFATLRAHPRLDVRASGSRDAGLRMN
jgi:hypothetical protein